MAAQKKEDKKVAPRMVCLHCGTSDASKFYVSKDIFNKCGKIPYCKDCIKNVLYPYYLSKSNNENIAFHHLLRALNVPYIHDVYISSLESLDNPNAKINNSNDGENVIVSSYFKNFNSLHDKNGYGNIYLDSVGLDQIEGLQSFDDIVKVRRNRDNISSNEDSEVIDYDIDYLIHKYGNMPTDDLIFLEEEYLQWADKLGDFIRDQSIRMNVIILCNEYLKLRKKNEHGESTREETMNIQTIMKTSGLAEKIEQNEKKSKPIGVRIEDIEMTRPVKPVDSVLNDVDGYRNLILGFAGATARSLGKENEYTSAFDRIMGKYTLDVMKMPEAEDTNDGSDSKN